MEGLEVKELNFKEILIDNEKFRFDDEFFLKKHLNAYSLVKSKPNIKLKEILEVLTDFSANGSYATIAKNFILLDEPDYAYMVRSTDLEKLDFENNVKYVDKHSYNFLSKSIIYGGEILINKIGSPGRVYLMPTLNKPVSLGMNLFMLRIKSDSGFSEKYIWAFFNTELGQSIIQRKVNGTVPLTIDKEAVRTLYIPIISKNAQEQIVELIDVSNEKLDQSKLLYRQAETLLLREIGLQGFTPSTEPVNIKSFKESFGVSGRLDAEYYQKKYDELIETINNINHKSLNDIVSMKKSIEPGSSAYQTEGVPFIRVSNITKFGISQPEIYLDRKVFTDEDLRPKKDTILLSKDGSVGIAYKVEQDLEVITSSALLHLTVTDNEILPDYLTLVLNSKLTQMQAERDAGGSIIQHWRPDEIKQVLIPVLPLQTQQTITYLIQESFRLKEESENLLEVAKHAVEIAIEQDEQAAMEFIKKEVETVKSNNRRCY